MLKVNRKDYAGRLNAVCEQCGEDIASLFRELDMTALVMYEEGEDDCPGFLSVVNCFNSYDIEVRGVIVRSGGSIRILDEEGWEYGPDDLARRTDITLLYDMVVDRLRGKGLIETVPE